MASSTLLQKICGMLVAGTAVVATGWLLYDEQRNPAHSLSKTWSTSDNQTLRSRDKGTAQTPTVANTGSNKRKSIVAEAQECFKRAKRAHHKDQTNYTLHYQGEDTELEIAGVVLSPSDVEPSTLGPVETITTNTKTDLATIGESSKDGRYGADHCADTAADNGFGEGQVQTGKVDDMQVDIEDECSELQDTESTIDEEEEKEEGEENEEGANDEEDRFKLFRPVMAALNLTKLEQLTLLLRLHHLQRQSNHPLDLSSMLNFSCEVVKTPMHGACNLAYKLNFSDGETWIARIPGHGTRFGELDARKMDAEYQTMRHIKANTSIPIPEVFHWDTSCISVGAPFALMSFVHGRALSEVWDMGLTDAQRLSILSDVAQCMVQFSRLSFNQKGMLASDQCGNVEGIGPEIQLEPLDDMPWHKTYAQGPYNTMTEALVDSMAEAETEDLHIRGRADVRLVRLVLDSIPEYLINDTQFAIAPSEIGYQNVFVDPVDYHITGFIDFDGVGTEGSCSGYARYPSWITCDWDPILYDYDTEAIEQGEECFDQSPETLSRYRRHYAAAFEKLATELNVDGYDTRMTKLSHIMEGFLIALTVCESRPLAVKKLLDHAFNGRTPFTQDEYANDLEAGATSEKDALIKEAFATMWHTEWEAEKSPKTEDDCELSDPDSLVTVATADSVSDTSSDMSSQEGEQIEGLDLTSTSQEEEQYPQVLSLQDHGHSTPSKHRQSLQVFGRSMPADLESSKGGNSSKASKPQHQRKTWDEELREMLAQLDSDRITSKKATSV